MPTAYMLIGIPAAGKSTWVKNNASDAVVLSTDDKIEAVAKSKNLTYNDVFQKEFKSALASMNLDLKKAIANKKDIIWDQTNLTKKSRQGKLSQIPLEYKKIAVYFSVPIDLEQRLASRPGKTIPSHVIAGMMKQIEMPSKDEGFDEIHIA